MQGMSKFLITLIIVPSNSIRKIMPEIKLLTIFNVENGYYVLILKSNGSLHRK